MRQETKEGIPEEALLRPEANKSVTVTGTQEVDTTSVPPFIMPGTKLSAYQEPLYAKCIICGALVEVPSYDREAQVCRDCKNAVLFIRDRKNAIDELIRNSKK